MLSRSWQIPLVQLSHGGMWKILLYRIKHLKSIDWLTDWSSPPLRIVQLLGCIQCRCRLLFSAAELLFLALNEAFTTWQIWAKQLARQRHNWIGLKSICISKNEFVSLFIYVFILFLNQYNRSPPAARKSLNNHHSAASSNATSPTASTPTPSSSIAHTLLSPQSGQPSSRNRSRSPTPHASLKNPGSPSTTEQLQVNHSSYNFFRLSFDSVPVFHIYVY